MARGKDKDKANALIRQYEALDLRQSGWSFRAIGDKLGVTGMQAWRDVKSALEGLEELNTDKASTLRQLELERLDALTKGLEPMAMVGNVGSVSAYIRVMEQRAKLLGLYAPEKRDINIKHELIIELVNALQTAGISAEEFFTKSIARAQQQALDAKR